VCQWLWTRGEFILIDGVAQDRAAFVDQWREAAPQSNALMVFRVVMGLIQSGILAVALGVMSWHLVGVLLWSVPINPLLIAGVCGGWMVLATAIGLPVGVVEVMLAKVMYARRCSVTEGLATTVSLIQRDLGSFVVFLIARIVLAIAVFVATMWIALLVCFLSWIPYLSTLVILPLIVIRVAFDLHFIAGYGGEFAMLGPDVRSPPPSSPASSDGPQSDREDNVWAEPTL
jgi:hypothetical protein